MTFLLLCASVFLLSGKVITALQCHTCADVNRQTGQASLTCDDFYIRNHTEEHLQGCQDPAPGHVVRCSKFGGQASKVEETGSTVIMEGVSRGCINFKENSLPESRCYYGEEASPWLSSLVPGTEGASVNGLVCFCEGSGCNSVGSLQPLLWLLICTLMTLYAIL